MSFSHRSSLRMILVMYHDANDFSISLLYGLNVVIPQISCCIWFEMFIIKTKTANHSCIIYNLFKFFTVLPHLPLIEARNPTILCPLVIQHRIASIWRMSGYQLNSWSSFSTWLKPIRTKALRQEVSCLGNL